MAHLHEVRDMDTHYAIDPITMAITNANEVKNKLMLGDHDSEIYTFEIPRVIEGHDMSLCNLVEVHFINIATDKANKSVGVYTVKDLAQAEDAEDTLVFTWKVSGESTMYAGSLNYRIKFACLDGNGKYTYKKWTDVYKGITISDGFDNGAAVAKEYSDILSDWEARLDALEQGGASDEQIAQAVNNYLQENPVQSGATDEQAAQIKQNKEDIEKLATDMVDNDQLLNAVNDALEQAKASGDFKGEPGDDYVLTNDDKQEIAEQAAQLVDIPEGGTVTDEQIAEALENYLKNNPITSGASIFYSSLSFKYNAGSMLSLFNCDKQEIRRNGRNIQVGDLIIFGNLSLGIVEKVTDTQVSGSLYASLKGEPGSGGGLDATIDGETLVFAESSTATIENETLIL
jgi:hypothetical protein